jgi:hypothetical protein
MKLFKLIFPVLAGIFIFRDAASQNASINILSQNSGTVRKEETAFLEVTVNNTDELSSIGVYKIKAQINVPSTIASIADTGHVLPKGWKIISNNGSTIILSNGADIIGPASDRNILIAIVGKKTGGPSTMIGQLSFSNGSPPGTEVGFLTGDNPGDNSSTTTIKVVK